MMIKKITLLLNLCVVLLVSACGDVTEAGGGTPGDKATAYFDALYNKSDLAAASSMATPNLARIMKSYGTTKQFTRNLVNLQFDTVVIEVDMSNMSLREQYGDTAKINLIFTGYLNGNKVDDMRSVKLLRKKGTWYVDKILADPFAR